MAFRFVPPLSYADHQALMATYVYEESGSASSGSCHRAESSRPYYLPDLQDSFRYPRNGLALVHCKGCAIKIDFIINK